MNDSINPDLFRKAAGHWATGVSIVTTVDTHKQPFGLTMNALTSVSLDPPLYLVCVDNGSDTLAPMRASKVFCINVLAEDQQELSNRFAKKSATKFDGVEFRQGSTGTPILGGALMSLECRVIEIFPAGDHEIFVGEVKTVTLQDGEITAEPLLYYRGNYAALAG